ncbi:hypothetical protein CYMTET_43957 [Cymbomonas tetramitiformis]|uniref:Uncharacterized protein n=1 Tax=Cymbomonas tetramitiformis TaxID=36881 RepID=A0AAE0C2B5_9CHLO|nr:hypothetical protein CYMTET_43957 [Cymbomonas tetramitiformis]
MMDNSFNNAGAYQPVTSTTTSPQSVAPFVPAVSEVDAHFGVPPPLVPQSAGVSLSPYNGSGQFTAQPGAAFDAGLMMTPQQQIFQQQQFFHQQGQQQMQQQLAQLEVQHQWLQQQQQVHQHQLQPGALWHTQVPSFPLSVGPVSPVPFDPFTPGLAIPEQPLSALVHLAVPGPSPLQPAFAPVHTVAPPRL